MATGAVSQGFVRSVTIPLTSEFVDKDLPMMVHVQYNSWITRWVFMFSVLLPSDADLENTTTTTAPKTTAETGTGCNCREDGSVPLPHEDGEGSPLQKWVRLKRARDYDYGLTPMENETEPVHVSIHMEVGNMLDLNEKNMDFSLDIYLRQIWTDHRLAYSEEIPNISSIGIPDIYYSDIWLPDTFMENGKYEELHTVTMANRMFRVRNDGTIWYSQRLRLVMWCNLKLHRFPLDQQICGLRYATYRYTTDEIILNWHSEEAVDFGNQELAMFYHVHTTLGDCTGTFITGTFSCISVDMHFDRRFGFYLVQVYVPSILIVMLSWVSFWLDPHSVPARISVGILTILAMTNQLSAVASESLPKVSYIKAMDIWLTCCMSFLCASVLEFAVANTLARHYEMQKSVSETEKPRNISPRRKKRVEDLYMQTFRATLSNENDGVPSCKNCNRLGRRNIYSITENGFHAPEAENRNSRSCCAVTDPSVVDRVARVIFPLAFFLFNVVYWVVYLT